MFPELVWNIYSRILHLTTSLSQYGYQISWNFQEIMNWYGTHPSALPYWISKVETSKLYKKAILFYGKSVD